MHPSLIILAVASSFITGFALGIIVYTWYDEKVKKPVDKEQKRVNVDDDRIFFDCEKV